MPKPRLQFAAGAC